MSFLRCPSACASGGIILEEAAVPLLSTSPLSVPILPCVASDSSGDTLVQDSVLQTILDHQFLRQILGLANHILQQTKALVPENLLWARTQ